MNLDLSGFRLWDWKQEGLLFAPTEEKHSLMRCTILMIFGTVTSDHLLLGAYFNMGIIGSILATIAVVVLMATSHWLNQKTWVVRAAYSLNEVSAFTLGRRFGDIAIVIEFLVYLLVVTWCISDFGYLLSTFLVEKAGPSIPAPLLDPNIWRFVLSVFYVAPMMALAGPHSFIVPALISLTCIVVSTACLVTAVESVDPSLRVRQPLFAGRFSDFTVLLSRINVALFAAPFAPRISRTLDRATGPRISCVTFSALSFSTLAMIIGGVWGSQVRRIFPDDYLWWEVDMDRLDVTVGIIASFVVNGVSLAYFCHHAAELILQFFSVDSETEIWGRVASGLMVCFASIFIQTLDPIATSITDGILNVALGVLIFGAPAVFFMRQYRHRRGLQRVWSIGVLLFFIVALLLMAYGSVLNVRAALL